MLSRTVASLALALPLVSSARASVIVVPANAPAGALQTAVDGALNGDILLVGSGNSSAVLVNGKGITIAADVGAVPSIATVRITNVPAGQTVTLHGLRLQAFSGDILSIVDCAGAIRVQGCLVEKLHNWTFPQAGTPVVITNAADVALTACTLRCNAWSSATGLRATGSSVAIHDASIVAGSGKPAGVSYPFGGGSPFAGAAGGTGILATSSILLVSGTTIHGGNGGAGFDSFGCSSTAYDHPTPGGAGGTALVCTGASSAELVDAALVGGVGGANGHTPCDPGPYTSAPSGAPSSGNVVVLPALARRVLATGVAREGGTLALAYEGEPGDRVHVAIGNGSAHVSVPALFGTLLVGSPLRRVYLGTTDANGDLGLELPIGELGAGVEGLVRRVQTFVVDANGATVLGPPAQWILLDAAF